MNKLIVIPLLLVATLVIADDLSERSALVPHEIHSITIILDSRLVEQDLLEFSIDGRTLIREFATLVSRAESGDDHKCRDIGEIRFGMRDGSTVRVGLLPAHQDGIYNLRFYGAERYSVGQVDRESLLGLLERAGIPARSPEFPG
jgi:hypothetical protein